MELSLNSANSGNLINQFKDPVSHMCLAGAVVASWSLTPEVAGLNQFNNNYFLSVNSLNSVIKIRKNSNKTDSMISVLHLFGSNRFLSQPLPRRQRVSVFTLLWDNPETVNRV